MDLHIDNSTVCVGSTLNGHIEEANYTHKKFNKVKMN
jgi:hypothetical protein